MTQRQRSSSGHGWPSSNSGNSMSPDEMSGQAPDPPELSLSAEAILISTPGEHLNTGIRPMGFRKGDAPEYPTQICYRNAAMTMLLNLPCFTNWLEEGYSSFRPEEPFYNFVDDIQLLADTYWSQKTLTQDEEQERVDVCMDAFWNSFLAANPGFTEQLQHNYYPQEDAALFLTTLFDSALDFLDPLR